MRNVLLKSVLFAAISISASSYAKDVFVANIQVDNSEIKNLGFDNIVNFADQYTNRQLINMFPSYTNNSRVIGNSDLRGVPVKMSFPANSGVLRLEIPSLNIVREYGVENGSRSIARNEFVDAIKGKDKELMQALTAEWAKKSAIDAVAGNPTSLLSNMVTASMDTLANVGYTGMAGNQTLGNQLQQSNTSVSMMPRFGRYTLDGYGSSVYTLPLAYATTVGQAQTTELSIDAPVTIVNTEGALTFGGSIGLGMNYQVYSSPAYDWYLMPNIRFGATGSEDLGTVAMIYGGGLSSKFYSPINDKSAISILNIISYLKTSSIEVEGVDSHYDLTNTILRNGVEYAHALNKTVAGSPLIAKFQLARTDYLGDDLYADVTHDISASLGFMNNKKNAWIKEFRAGLTYSYVDSNSNGISINAGYTF